MMCLRTDAVVERGYELRVRQTFVLTYSQSRYFLKEENTHEPSSPHGMIGGM